MSGQATARQRFLRMTPRKTRAVADLIRDRNCAEAINLLKFLPRAAKVPVEKTLRSAIANAVSQTEKGRLNPEDLRVKEVYVDGGVTLKRYRPRARGRADVRRKRTSHLVIRVSRVEAEEGPSSEGRG
jgi:large subunit ribosomal protein L22